MPYGRPPSVRSHRRGGPRRRVSIAPWLIIGTVVLLVGAGLTAGYMYFIHGKCSGSASATVVVSPRIEMIMRELAQEWKDSSPNVNGACGEVQIEAADSAEVATALSNDWDTKSQGPTPDAWVPDSSAWVRRASVDADAERMMPDLQPSLARTPTVIAMPKEMADAAGMTAKPLNWKQIIDKLSSPEGWKAYRKAEWGAFRVGMADPQSSTAGLLSLMAISDTNDDGEVDESEQATLLGLKKVIKLQVGATSEIFSGLKTAAEQDKEAAYRYVSAFPALEQEIVTYNVGNPRVPLVAVYPQDGSAEADFPFLVLEASWSTARAKDVATAFMRFSRTPQRQALFLDAGFRNPNRAAGSALTPANGVVTKVTALPRAILLPESVQHASASWTAVTRPTNVLFVFDTSGSMNATVPGTGRTRLDLTKAAAIGALKLFEDEARVGVWAFSTRQSGQDHRKILPLTPLGDGTGGGTHRDDVIEAINDLRGGGNTGLYNTVWAAQQEVQANLQPGAANMVVLLTDGADDNNIAGSLTLNNLITKLRGASTDPNKRVPVITIGLGTDSDSNILRQISTASKGPTFSSPTSFDISQVVLTALFSRI